MRFLMPRQMQIGVCSPAIAAHPTAITTAHPARSVGNESPVSEVAQGMAGWRCRRMWWRHWWGRLPDRDGMPQTVKGPGFRMICPRILPYDFAAYR